MSGSVPAVDPGHAIETMAPLVEALTAGSPDAVATTRLLGA